MTTSSTRPSSTIRCRALARAGLLLPAIALALAACGATPAAAPTHLPSPTSAAAVRTPGSAAATVTGTSVAPTTAPTAPAARPGTPAPPASASTPTQAAGPAATAPATPAPTLAAVTPKLNLNTATREQFLGVPGVGDRMVREFLEYRPYRSIQQFRREIGKYVPQEQVAAYERHVFVPVDPNGADAETLQQIPGVDAALATQLVAARPYASPAAFLTRLGQHLTPDQVTAARGYLATP